MLCLTRHKAECTAALQAGVISWCRRAKGPGPLFLEDEYDRGDSDRQLRFKTYFCVIPAGWREASNRERGALAWSVVDVCKTTRFISLLGLNSNKTILD